MKARLALRPLALRPLAWLLLLAWLAAPAGGVEPAVVRVQVERVFARPEFAWKHPRPRPTGSVRVSVPWLKPLYDAWRRFWAWMRPPPEPASVTTVAAATAVGRLLLLMLYALALLAAVPLLRALRRLIAMLREDAGPAAAEAEADVLDDPEVLARWETLERKARDALQAGQLRLAIRAYYLAVLSRLEEQGAIRYARGTTNTEYLRQAEARPGLADPMRRVTGQFDRSWYGHQDPTAEAAAAYVASCATLLRPS